MQEYAAKDDISAFPPKLQDPSIPIISQSIWQNCVMLDK